MPVDSPPSSQKLPGVAYDIKWSIAMTKKGNYINKYNAPTQQEDKLQCMKNIQSITLQVANTLI